MSEFFGIAATFLGYAVLVLTLVAWVKSSLSKDPKAKKTWRAVAYTLTGLIVAGVAVSGLFVVMFFIGLSQMGSSGSSGSSSEFK